MVHVQAHRAILMGQGLTGDCAGVAFVSDEAAYHGTVLLLYPRLVVLWYARERVNSMPRSSQ